MRGSALDENERRKQAIADVFGRSAATYDSVGPRFFAPLGRRLVALAQLPTGARVLDVATGRGAVLFPAADHVGPGGHVCGVDLAGPMVQATNDEIRRRGIANADARVMDAENLRFADDHFDAVLCAFALFFMPHARQALCEFRRVLKAGGRVALATWGKDDERWSWCFELMKQYLPPEPDPPNTDPSTGFDRPEYLEQHLRAAGFRDVRVIEEAPEFVYSSADEWWQTQWSHGGRQALESLAPDTLAQFRHDACERFNALRTQDGLPIRMAALFTLAAK